jgi:hypothetical protein
MTSELKWRFSPKRPADKTRDPVAGEFFASDAIKDAGEALVREAIQNSLDARRDRLNGKAVVRIYLSGETGALAPAVHQKWFDTAWPHYEAPNNGLLPNAVKKDAPCRFLVFEDFETTGLEGDREQYEQKEGAKNPFFYFFRAEGATEKHEATLGRWGIGKQVFPRSSKAQTFFGYTETKEGGFLMGGCILQHHTVSGVTYKPDGFFGLAKDIAGDALTIPTPDKTVLDQFRNDYKIDRKPGQHGLSVVVPWLDEAEGVEKVFDKNTLALAVIEDYFAPILEGRLEATIVDPDGSMVISAANYKPTLDQLELSANDKRKREIRRLRAHIELAEAARTPIKMFELPPCHWQKATWTDEMVSENMAKEVRELLLKGDVVGATATVTVRPSNGTPSVAKFNCYLKKAEQMNEKPCHIRENLIISDVESSRLAGFAGLIRIDPGPLAELLADSENPAHTEWQKSARKFKGKYTYGGLAIDFASNFALEFIRRVYSNSKQLDRKLLVDLFSDTGPDEVSDPPDSKKDDKRTAKTKNQKTEKDEISLPPDAIPPSPPRPSVRLGELSGGFTITAGPTPPPMGAKVKVRVAYETSKGDPFKSYRPHDFRLETSDFDCKLVGCNEVERKNNTLSIEVVEPEKFAAQVRGFDANRDLIVKTTLQLKSPGDGEEETSEN